MIGSDPINRSISYTRLMTNKRAPGPGNISPPLQSLLWSVIKSYYGIVDFTPPYGRSLGGKLIAGATAYLVQQTHVSYSYCATTHTEYGADEELRRRSHNNQQPAALLVHWLYFRLP